MGHLMPYRDQQELSLLEHAEKYVDVMDIGSCRTAHDLLLPELKDIENVFNQLKGMNYTGVKKDVYLFQDDVDRLTSILIKLKGRINLLKLKTNGEVNNENIDKG